MNSITVVTAVLDGMPYLPQALASVERESCGSGAVEHIVVDGGSADGSAEMLREMTGLRLFERPGLSIYEAWNLAVAEARGDRILFVNADDTLAPGALSAVDRAASRHPAADVLFGAAETFSDTNGPEAPGLVLYRGARLTGPDPQTFVFGAPIINAKVFRRSVFERNGAFDVSYALAADRAFLLGLLVTHPKLDWRPIDALVYRYRIHAGSRTLAPTPARRTQMADEHIRLAHRALNAPNTPSAMRSLLKSLIAREGLARTVALIRQGRLGTAADAMLRTVLRDPLGLRVLAAQGAVRSLARSARVDASRAP